MKQSPSSHWNVGVSRCLRRRLIVFVNKTIAYTHVFGAAEMQRRRPVFPYLSLVNDVVLSSGVEKSRPG